MKKKGKDYTEKEEEKTGEINGASRVPWLDCGRKTKQCSYGVLEEKQNKISTNGPKKNGGHMSPT